MPLTDQQRRKLSIDLQRIAKVVEKELRRATGQRMAFSLVIWGAFGGDEMTQYVANVAREDALQHMLEIGAVLMNERVTERECSEIPEQDR